MTVTPSLMKRWELLSLSPANLKMAQVARPAPSTTEVLVEVEAVSLNLP
jgi:NADPH:quinone reductase-like Zn-dependent oxidoreductase